DHVNKNSDPFEYRKVMDAKFDSLYQFYTSGTTTRQFMRVTICDEKLWHKKYRIITDSEEILNLWKFLASSYPVKVKSWPYLVQYPLSVLPLLKFNFDVAILSTPFVYPALIATEIFVIDRFNAGKTYRIIFQPRDIGTNGCRLKVRNSMIMGFKYHFVLSSNFEKQVFK